MDFLGECEVNVQSTAVTESEMLQHLLTQIFWKSIIGIKNNAEAEVDQEEQPPGDQQEQPPGDPEEQPPGDQEEQPPEEQPGEGVGLPPVITTVFGLVFASKYSTASHLPVVHFHWLHIFYIF